MMVVCRLRLSQLNGEFPSFLDQHIWILDSNSISIIRKMTKLKKKDHFEKYSGQGQLKKA